MAESKVIDGNEAIGWGAIYAGCTHFFGYPITPQNEVPEFMSRELPKLGRVFLQTESELGSIYMVQGAAMAGARAMTSTSGPGFSLMQEGMSLIAECDAPAVIAYVQRLGPGAGGGGPGAQQEYFQVTKPSGHGYYRVIVLAASSAKEVFEFMQLGFHLADKYRMAVIVLSDFLVARMQEPVDMRTIDFGKLPPKDWALVGKGKKGGVRNWYWMEPFSGQDGPIGFYQRQHDKYEEVKKNEVRFETYRTEDCDFLLAAYGSTARIAMGTVDMGREQGIKLGLFRPITLWPFPEEAFRKAARAAGRVLVIEDGPAEMAEDMKYMTCGEAPVHFLGIWARHEATVSGIIYPERILEEVKRLL